MLRCSDDTLYTGWTNDIKSRVAAHNSKKGAKYTKGRTPVMLVYLEIFDTKKEAMKREAEIKRFTRYEKEALIKSERNKKELIAELGIYSKSI